MAPGKKGPKHAEKMIDEIERIGKSLGLSARRNVPAGKTVWTTARKIKIVLESTSARNKSKKSQVGMDCIYQEKGGTAYVKFFAKAEDVKEYPMRGIVVYAGPSFGAAFEGVMNSRGALPLNQLKSWLKEFFNL